MHKRPDYFLPSAIICFFLVAVSGLFGQGIVIKGANGVDVEFAGVRLAEQGGLRMMLSQEQGEIFVPWERFDLQDMADRNPSIYRAYREVRPGGVPPVDLGLGIYEKLQTLDQFCEAMRKRAEQTVNLPLHPMTAFFDMSGFEGRYTTSNNLYATYTNWERTSTRYAEEYERFINELFSLETPESYRSHWTLTSRGRRFIVVSEVRPPKTSHSLPLNTFLYYFGDGEMRSHNVGVNYLRMESKVLDELIAYLDDKRTTLESGFVMIDQRTLNSRVSSLNMAHRHISNMRESRSLNANIHRDMERYLREWRFFEN